MDNQNIFDKMIRHFRRRRQAAETGPAGNQDSSYMKKILRMIQMTDENELSCEEVFDLGRGVRCCFVVTCGQELHFDKPGKILDDG